MPHARIKTKYKLSRERGPRLALLRSLSYHLLMQGRITTTKPKAKALVPFIEKIITKAKRESLHSRRQVISRLGSNEAARRLYEELLPKLKSRSSGHVRVKRVGYRQGDQAPLAEVSLILDESKPATPAKGKAGPKLPKSSETKAASGKKPPKEAKK